MIEELLRALGFREEPIPRRPNGVPPESEAERAYEQARRQAERTIRRANADTARVRRQIPSWESLLEQERRR